ncbi:uncharacterized protein C8A04DRAFT_23782 [Dichotomopilus funicola]|uniref:Uncharacterized protein n=1 Tax=Dichotomopilus funicola TaxID=1934379 RepID=A0AAN6VDA3_9PEZI|nr:hypothetical protein C8A04DRAFT_23782 [Dichotomopilus funicola]
MSCEDHQIQPSDLAELERLGSRERSRDHFDIGYTILDNHHHSNKAAKRFYIFDHKSVKMTRSHKFNDKDHAGLADGTVLPQESVPKFFGKHGFADADPKKAKKNGAGRAGWGNAGAEVVDENFNFHNARRRSNSSSISTNLENFKTKFEVNEPEPVFEENMGPQDEEAKPESQASDSSVDENKSH